MEYYLSVLLMYSFYGQHNPLYSNAFYFLDRNYSGRRWNWFFYKEMFEMGLSSVSHSVILTRFRFYTCVCNLG